MNDPVRLAVAAILGYLLGSIPFGLLLTRTAGLGDIRAVGSGNIGATNVLRTGRKGLAAATLALDAAKGMAAVMAAFLLAGSEGLVVGGVAATAGHIAPIWLRFRGGKGVATGFGVLLAAAPLAAVGAAAVWLAVAGATRISSAGALAAATVAPLLAWAAGGPLVGLMALVVAALIWFRHIDNIARLLAGTEPRIGTPR